MSPRKRSKHGSTEIQKGTSAEFRKLIHSTGPASWCPSTTTLLLLASALYVTAPILMHFSETVQRGLVYLHFVAPPFANLSDLSRFEPGYSANTFFLPTRNGETLGAWHVLPHGSKASRSEEFVAALGDGKPVIIYFHGNAGTRGFAHRTRLYKMLSDIQMHVIAIDYRGFADSAYILPNNESVVSDAIDTFRWVRQRTAGPLFVWGHSLGTGVSIQAISRLCANDFCPAGLALEAPFTSIESAAATNPAGWPWAWLLKVHLFKELFFQRWTQKLDSLATIDKVSCPLFIVHSDDDALIDYRDSQRLAVRAKESRADSSTVHHHVLSGYGHVGLYRYPNMSDLFREFVATYGKSPAN